jgi:DNA-binding NarL/FixJ family response regulator
MRATSLQEHEAERYNHSVVGMESSHLQQGCEAPRLTSQERAVLELLCRYDHVPQVAAALYVQPDTVRKHLRHIYRKLGVHSLHRAIVRALALGLIEPPTEPHDDATPPNPPVERQKSAKFPKLGD